MTVVKLAFLGVMVVCAIIAFVTPLIFSEAKYKNDPARRIRNIVKVRMVCFMVVLVLMLLCLILK